MDYNNSNEGKEHTDLRKYIINQQTWYKIILISQSWKKILLCKRATQILATTFQMKTNKIQIEAGKE